MSRSNYGLMEGLRVSGQYEDHVILGQNDAGDSGAKFEQVLTWQAAHFLWIILTRALFPLQGKDITLESAERVVPFTQIDGSRVTSHVGVFELVDGYYEIFGATSDGHAWEVRVGFAEGKRLWAGLDIVLYPMGWAGREPYR